MSSKGNEPTQEPPQRSGGLGPVVPTTPQKNEPEEKWVACHTPGYVRSTKTGAVKEKGN
jgi:hypothetical protein